MLPGAIDVWARSRKRRRSPTGRGQAEPDCATQGRVPQSKSMINAPLLPEIDRLERLLSAEYEALERRVRRDTRWIGYALLVPVVIVVLGAGLPLIAWVIAALLWVAGLVVISFLLGFGSVGRRVQHARDVLRWVALYGLSSPLRDGRYQVGPPTGAVDVNEPRRVEALRLVRAAGDPGSLGGNYIALLAQARTVLGALVREFETADSIAFRRRAMVRGSAMLIAPVALLVGAALGVGRLASIW